MVYRVFFETVNGEECKWGEYTSKAKADAAVKFLMKDKETYRVFVHIERS